MSTAKKSKTWRLPDILNDDICFYFWYLSNNTVQTTTYKTAIVFIMLYSTTPLPGICLTAPEDRACNTQTLKMSKRRAGITSTPHSTGIFRLWEQESLSYRERQLPWQNLSGQLWKVGSNLISVGSIESSLDKRESSGENISLIYR